MVMTLKAAGPTEICHDRPAIGQADQFFKLMRAAGY
jgi:hypothetical protein